MANLPVNLAMIDYSPYIAGLQRRERERKASLEQRRQRALETAKKIALSLRHDFGASEVYLFGSTLAPGEFHAHSDIDIAAIGIDPKRYLSAIGEVLGMSGEFSVDVLDFSSCRPELKASILKEGIKL